MNQVWNFLKLLGGLAIKHWWYMALGAIGTYLVYMWMDASLAHTSGEGWFWAFILLWIAHIWYVVGKFKLAGSEERGIFLTEVPFAPGDIVDKFVILVSKAEHLGQGHPSYDALAKEAIRTLLFLEQLIQLHPVDKEALAKLGEELDTINREQWQWESKVRKEHSWECAVGARECNARRVAKKNEINKLFGWYEEVKSY